MPRNLFRRVELSFPVEGKHEKRVLHEALEIHLEDNVMAWEMAGDGSYRRLEPKGAPPFDSQAELLKLLAKLPG
jgi:polyphosphate kinase